MKQFVSSRIYMDWITQAARAHATITASLMMLSKRACLVRKIASLENELDFSWFPPRAGHEFWSFIQPMRFRFHPWKLDDAQLQDVSGFDRFIHGVSRRYFEVLQVFWGIGGLTKSPILHIFHLLKTKWLHSWGILAVSSLQHIKLCASSSSEDLCLFQ